MPLQKELAEVYIPLTVTHLRIVVEITSVNFPPSFARDRIMADKRADTADSQQQSDKQKESKGKEPEHISTEFTHRKALPKAFDLSDEAQTGGGVSAQEMQFVRRVTELLPILSPEQVDALRERIAGGYYGNPEVTRIIAQRLSEIFGTD